jgi:hypothetical protein
MEDATGRWSAVQSQTVGALGVPQVRMELHPSSVVPPAMATGLGIRLLAPYRYFRTIKAARSPV